MAVVRGIAVMNNSPAKARILYGKVDSESLQAIADGIMKQFYESGKPTIWNFQSFVISLYKAIEKCMPTIRRQLVYWRNVFVIVGLAKATRGKSSVKLHMTLLKMRNHKPRHIDARDLLVKYAGFEFGSQHIDEIHLAAIRSNNATPDGFYEIVSSIPVWRECCLWSMSSDHSIASCRWATQQSMELHFSMEFPWIKLGARTIWAASKKNMSVIKLK